MHLTLCPSFEVLSLLVACLSGESHAHSIHPKRGLAVPTDLPAGWSYLGCYTDGVGARTFAASTYNGNAMTDESCVSFCANQGYPYAGTEYGGECYCGASIASTGAVAPASDCNVSFSVVIGDKDSLS